MQGYIKRLTQEIKKTELKMGRITYFLAHRRQEVDEKQVELLSKQYDIMYQLVDILKQRLEYERQIHPERFEDLSEENCGDGSEE